MKFGWHKVSDIGWLGLPSGGYWPKFGNIPMKTLPPMKRTLYVYKMILEGKQPCEAL